MNLQYLWSCCTLHNNNTKSTLIFLQKDFYKHLYQAMQFINTHLVHPLSFVESLKLPQKKKWVQNRSTNHSPPLAARPWDDMMSNEFGTLKRYLSKLRINMSKEMAADFREFPDLWIYQKAHSSPRFTVEVVVFLWVFGRNRKKPKISPEAAVLSSPPSCKICLEFVSSG